MEIQKLSSIVFLIGGVAAAHAAVIDFEDVVIGSGGYTDVGSPFVYANAGGSGVDVSFVEGADNRVYDLVTYGGYSGPGRNGLIDLNWNNFQNPLGTDILFSSAVQNFSLIAGDFGGDEDSPLRIEAFDGAGNSLGVDTADWPANQFPPFALLELNVSGIRRVHYSSGGDFTGSTFIDNVTFTPQAVPEPATMAALALGAGVLLRRRRR